MSTPTIGIAISHAAHRPERVAAMKRLEAKLRDWPGPVHVESEKNPHHIWAMRMWRFLHGSGADYCVCLQDDTLVPDNLHAALSAFFTTHPGQVYGLFGSHPLMREFAKQGQRVYRSRAWILGIAYALARPMMDHFFPWAERNEEKMRQCAEDSFVNRWVVDHSLDVWHPIPALADHDLSLPSTWGADIKPNRRATVTWESFFPAELEKPSFWVNPGPPRLVLDAMGAVCWGCLQEPAYVDYTATGMGIGARCWALAGERMMQQATRQLQGV